MRTTVVANKIKDKIQDSCIGLQVPERRSPKLPGQLAGKMPRTDLQLEIQQHKGQFNCPVNSKTNICI